MAALKVTENIVQEAANKLKQAVAASGADEVAVARAMVKIDAVVVLAGLKRGPVAKLN